MQTAKVVPEVVITVAQAATDAEKAAKKDATELAAALAIIGS